MAYAVFPAGEQDFSAPSGGDLSRSIFRLSDSLRQTRANIWRYPPGSRGRRHAEHVQEEVFVVLEGTATLYLGDPAETFELPRGSFGVQSSGRPSKLSKPWTSPSTHPAICLRSCRISRLVPATS